MSKTSIHDLLLVEDNLGDARLLREMLKESGPHDIVLTHVSTMADAEKHLAGHKADIILLDLGLPDAQGMGALTRVRAAAPTTPVMVFTGLDDEAVAIQALQGGAQDYLIKDQITTRGLMRALRHSVERNLLEEALFLEKERAVAMNKQLETAAVRQVELTVRAEGLNARLQAEIAASKRAQEALLDKESRIEAALLEKDVLLGEIHHRVKNNLQIVHSLLDLQSSQIQDPLVLSMLRDSQHRIRSMALIHQTLYQSGDFARVDFGFFLNSLVPVLINSYLKNPARIVLSIQAENMLLPINTAIPCGLLVNELISNCLKHAFPKEREGKIDIDFVHAGDEDVVLSVTDDGIGISEGFDLAESTSLGLQLVFLLTDQLRGEMAVDRANPTRFRLRFSLIEPARGAVREQPVNSAA